MTGRSLVRIQVGPPDRRRERRSSSEVEQGTHKPLAAGSNPASAPGLAEVVTLVDTQSLEGCELLLVRVRIPPSAPQATRPTSAFPYMGGHQLDGVPPICPGHGRLDRPHRRSAPVSWKVAAPPARVDDFWFTVATRTRGARD